jgi:PAS domain S-box-containing protein
MNNTPQDNRPRVLIVDDNAAIHGDFRKILGEQPGGRSHLDDVERALFGSPGAATERTSFRIDSAYQGQEALAMVEKAKAENDPYVLAFVDVRMPPGWDGVETLEHLWETCPELQAVICTAYADYSWDDITRRLTQTDNLLILKKPFDTIEALQIAHALTQKWLLAKQARLRMADLDRMVQERTLKLQREIEERVRVEEALRASEERFSKAFSASPMPMAIESGENARFLDANSSFYKLTGYDEAQLCQHTSEELQLWNSEQVREAMRSPDGVRNFPAVLRRRDGASRNVVLWIEPMRLGASPCMLVIMEDVTEHMRMEAQLRQGLKMEAVGCLAAGIAHEFNNLLTVIQGHAGLLRGNRIEARCAAESAERIFQASQRAASLTRRLLGFSRKQPVVLKSVNLSGTVQNLQKMLAQMIGERHTLELQCAPDLPPIRADESNMEQVVINLVLNARDAMHEGGAIRLDTRLALVDEAHAREHLEARPGDFLCLTVSDTGCGMTGEVLNRIFDPFYTTKEIGKGTGLGLSTVHAIVEQHQGWIEVETQIGRGSAFKVYFPVSPQASASASSADSGASAVPVAGAGEVVLVVEDEAIVRSTAKLTLEQAGYRVFDAADGREALVVWERCPARVDLLLTDMVMPNGLSGRDLAKELEARDPRLRTLYMTGYNSDAVHEGVVLRPGINFVPKPYDSATLLKAVKRCLGAELSGGRVGTGVGAASVEAC